MIVREGWPFILIGLVVTLLFVFGAVRWSSILLLIGAGLFGLLTLFTAYFFRNPDRVIPDNPLAVVAPADGRVVQIVSMEQHPFIEGPVTRVSIFLSVFDVHVNRVPVSGVIDYVQYNPGKFFAAFEDKASELNEQTEIGMTTTGGERVTYSQIAGIIARRIVCYLEPGDVVEKGERFGMIRFGSRTDLTVPANWEIMVEVGDKVTGGETIMVLMPKEPAVTGEPVEAIVDDSGEDDGDL